jgi:hypothetical protein
MSTFLLLTILALSGLANTFATAYFTGRSHYVTTVTGQAGVQCEYNYLGNKFWRTFLGSMCPNSVEVQ